MRDEDGNGCWNGMGMGVILGTGMGRGWNGGRDGNRNGDRDGTGMGTEWELEWEQGQGELWPKQASGKRSQSCCWQRSVFPGAGSEAEPCVQVCACWGGGAAAPQQGWGEPEVGLGVRPAVFHSTMLLLAPRSKLGYLGPPAAPSLPSTREKQPTPCSPAWDMGTASRSPALGPGGVL